jgi:WD40 repeat protein
MLVLQGARQRVEVLEFSPDGRTLVAPATVGVQVWCDPTFGDYPTWVLAHPQVTSVRCTPDGQKLLLWFLVRAVIYDLSTWEFDEVPRQLWGEEGAFCELSPDGRFLVIGQTWSGRPPPGLLCCVRVDDPGYQLWSVTSSRWLYTRPVFLSGGERFPVLEFSYPIPPSDPGIFYVIRDACTGAVLSEAPAKKPLFNDPVQSADKRWIAARRGACVDVYRADDLDAEYRQFHNDSRKEFTGLAFHPSGRYLAATSNDGSIKFYDTGTWKVARSFDWLRRAAGGFLPFPLGGEGEEN